MEWDGKDVISDGIEQTRFKPSIWIALVLYVGYLAVVFSIWGATKVEYTKIGETLESTKLHYAYPTMAGSLFLMVAISILGWWRPVFFDKQKSGPRWAWILPLTMLALSVYSFVSMNFDKATAQLILWSSLGALGVGFGEEVVCRGTMLFGFRNSMSEGKVWLMTTLLFSCLHVPNVFFGLSASGMAIQLVFTFILGSGLYAVRRLSGTLILPILLHGIWDSAVFLPRATGVDPASVNILIYPLAIICVIAVVRQNWNLGKKTG